MAEPFQTQKNLLEMIGKVVTELGKVSLNPKGEYEAETQYVRLDIVQYNGSGWICLQDSTPIGTTPEEGEYWMRFADNGSATSLAEAQEAQRAAEAAQAAAESAQKTAEAASNTSTQASEKAEQEAQKAQETANSIEEDWERLAAQVQAAAKSAQDAQTAQKSAEGAATSAQTAEQKIESLTVDVETITNEEEVSVEKQDADDHYNLHFKLPKGPKGEPGATSPTSGFIGFNVENEHLYLYYDNSGDRPNFSIDDQGHLCYTLTTEE